MTKTGKVRARRNARLTALWLSGDPALVRLAVNECKEALYQTDADIRRAAQVLRISRMTLYRYMRDSDALRMAYEQIQRDVIRELRSQGAKPSEINMRFRTGRRRMGA